MQNNENNTPQIIEDLSNRNIIKMSNDLASAQFNIREVSLNVFMSLLSEITMEDKELKEFDISLLQIENKLGRRLNRDPKKIEELCSDLLEKNILLAGDTDFISLCSKCELIKDGIVWVLSIKINSLLEKELLQLTREFTQINFAQFMQLNGLYAKRMYMLLKKVSGLKFWTVALEDLYVLLSVPSSYIKKFDAFKSRVLDPSIKQINNLEEKEITVSYTIDKRSGRKAKFIKFKIDNKSPKTKSLSILDEWAKKNGIDRT